MGLILVYRASGVLNLAHGAMGGLAALYADEYNLLYRDARGVREGAASASLPPTPGNPITTTIDLDLQRFIAQEMDTLQGGVIAMDPVSGEVFALRSLWPPTPVRRTCLPRWTLRWCRCSRRWCRA